MPLSFLLYTPYVGSSVEQSLMIERPVQNYGTAHLGLVFFYVEKWYRPQFISISFLLH